MRWGGSGGLVREWRETWVGNIICWNNEERAVYLQLLSIILIKHHSLTRVKLAALYKQLDEKLTYVHFVKQNFEYRVLR